MNRLAATFTFTLQPGFGALLRISLRRSFAYRVRFVMWVVREMLRLYLLRLVWEAVYDGRSSVDGIAAGTLLTYLTISILQDNFAHSEVMTEIDQRIQRGTVATDIVKPLGFAGQMLAIDLGAWIGRWWTYLPAIPLAALVGSLAMPPSLASGIGFAISAVSGYAINLLFWAIVAMFGFWMTNTGGLQFLVGRSMQLFTGVIIPLWFMPDWARTTLELLPFQGIIFLPGSIYVGETTGWGIIRAIALQWFWIVALAALLVLVWRRARHNVTVQGG